MARRGILNDTDMAPRLRPMSDSENKPLAPFLLRLTQSQREELKTRAQAAGMTMHAYAELSLFGEIRPRGRNGARPYKKRQHEELPMTG